MWSFIDCQRDPAGRDDARGHQGGPVGGAGADEPVSALGTPMRLFGKHTMPYSHSAAYAACGRTQLVAGCDLREDVLGQWGQPYGVAPAHLYTDYI